ncbi:DUF1989 domain-containing protein [Methylobacterium nonmethylotrophicum]|uniref:DUF1989 domain-containing protein n=1 Tax=Methylobacterium nonmethylotrophicum TaxID=1141884 RepID=UPI0014366F8A|nr:DUF1989 domain-containing protein [Methylobacterium nonmethylotrophicum]
MTCAHQHVVPDGVGHGFAAKAGTFVTLVDPAGQRPGDFVALTATDHRAMLSSVHTRRETLSRRPRRSAWRAGRGDKADGGRIVLAIASSQAAP